MMIWLMPWQQQKRTVDDLHLELEKMAENNSIQAKFVTQKTNVTVLCKTHSENTGED